MIRQMIDNELVMVRSAQIAVDAFTKRGDEHTAQCWDTVVDEHTAAAIRLLRRVRQDNGDATYIDSILRQLLKS